MSKGYNVIWHLWQWHTVGFKMRKGMLLSKVKFCSDAVKAGTTVFPLLFWCLKALSLQKSLAKYRSATASSSKLMSSLFCCTTKHNELFGNKLRLISPEPGWSERDPADHMSARPCYLISPAENDAERKCQQKVMHKQHSLCLARLRQALLTHPPKIRCSHREWRRQTAKWSFLSNALPKAQSLVIILLWSSNLIHGNIINAQFFLDELRVWLWWNYECRSIYNFSVWEFFFYCCTLVNGCFINPSWQLTIKTMK